MASARVTHFGPCRFHFWPPVILKHGKLFVLVGAVLLCSLAFSQAIPRVTAVEPSSGKVNDNVTVTGENLGKSTVAAVLLSDDTTDYKATLVEQGEGKIVMKVPQVKAGNYHVSLQEGINIFIQPVRFTVQ
jgi:hypothetical protein